MSSSGVYLSHDAQGRQNRDDLLDLIVNLSASDTPVFTMLDKTKAEGVYHQFLMHSTPRQTTNGATVEGADITYSQIPSPVRLTNYVQEITEPYKISYIQQKTIQAGPGSLAYARKEAMKEWKLHMEYSLLFNTGNSGASNTARQLKGLLNGGAIEKTTNVSGATLSENNFNNYLQGIWDDTEAKNLMAFLDMRLKRWISSNFITSTVKNLDESEVKKLSSKIDVYQSDVAENVMLYGHRDLRATNRFFVISRDAYKVALFENIRDIDTTTHTGNYVSGKIYGAGTLEFLYPKAAISVTNVA